MEVELNPEESICRHCEGTGEEPGKFIEGFRITCQRCWGDGKLDWVEMAMGKPIPQTFSSSSVSSSSCSTTSTKKEGVKNDTKWLHSRRFRNIGNDFRQFYVRQKRALERQLYQKRGR